MLFALQSVAQAARPLPPNWNPTDISDYEALIEQPQLQPSRSTRPHENARACFFHSPRLIIEDLPAYQAQPWYPGQLYADSRPSPQQPPRGGSSNAGSPRIMDRQMGLVLAPPDYRRAQQAWIEEYSNKLSNKPSKISNFFLGRVKAQDRQTRKNAQAADAVQRAHDAWLRIGVDTRQIEQQGGKLPPFFLNVPQKNCEEWHDEVVRLIG
ncbi:hypothetical protein K437DRAFT_67198 [Tilletiaria anomala UBC 951]|uniref:Uncharacterized protein n=1 Tax=Tilletiaria anomala (strain ATCC 24038 / CBS 436.72 / UBC 951) TaxID=1037660 RepID=A0A066W8Z3_TILAU|nr:uncharacterized protein K437DRAFT_67198 [Tilletiaria anomala UBC 951]KDN50417.1 hypothetical protein K437DRAFT_67198 [Tilletiaria anomala UBC 951]